MYKRFSNKNAKVLVATAFNKESSSLMLAAQDLAKASKMSLRLTHVCEPVQIYTLLSEYPGMVVTHMDLEEEFLTVARQNLKELAQTIDPSIHVETHVCLGHAASTLLADAKSANASMILCTHKNSSYRFIPRGFSTALELMAGADVPVMMINTEHPVSLNKAKLNILVTDDLRDGSRGAISVACELAFAFPGANITHLHVVPASKEEITTARKKLGKTFFDDAASSLANLEKSIKHDLASRFGQIGFLMEQNATKLTQQVAFGDLSEELEKVVKEKNIDIVIFGRHEKLHRRPLGVGKMPYYAMLNLKCPIIVAPDVLHSV